MTLATARAPIGIFGGTFDPVHLGHLRPALEVFEDLGLAELRLIPAHVPPHRASPQVDSARRLALLEAAIAGVPGFTVDDRELRREGPSYMVDTLASLRADFPDTPLCLILGMDAFLGLPRWHRWERLIELAHLVVLDRPGVAPPTEGALADWLAPRRVQEPQALHLRPAGAVYFHRVTQLEISATRIRAALAQGRSVRYLVPEPVRELIHRDGLYGAAAEPNPVSNRR